MYFWSRCADSLNLISSLFLPQITGILSEMKLAHFFPGPIQKREDNFL